MRSYTRTNAEELANAISHGIGVAASIIFFPILVLHAIENGTTGSVIGCILFSITMVVTYLSSTLYHALPEGRAKEIVLRLDHGSIFLLIAGTYAPFGLHQTDFTSITYFSLMWAFAVIGLVLKLMNKVQNVWVSLALYITMGWLGTTAVIPMLDATEALSRNWMIAGGVAYTTGVLFFAFGERIRYFHLAWHVFVMAGTAFHAAAVVSYLAS